MHTKTQIFYDKGRRRWKIIKVIVFLVSLVFFCSFFGIVFGIVSGPNLGTIKSKDEILFNNSNSAVINTAWQAKDLNLAKKIINKDYFPKFNESTLKAPEETFVFYQISNPNSRRSLEKHLEQVDNIFVDSLYLFGNQGSLREENINERMDLQRWIKAKKPSVNIILSISNFESNTFSEENIKNLFLNPEIQQKHFEQILIYANQNNLKSINISFFDIPKNLQTGFENYLINLTTIAHKNNLKIYTTLSFDDPIYNYKKIGKTVDFVILTAYNQTLPTDLAGPIASQAWVDSTLKQRVNDIAPEKIILSLANFGYDWVQNKPTKTLTFQEIMYLAEHYQPEIVYDTNGLNPKFKYKDVEGVSHQVWFLDAATFYNSVLLAHQAKIKGYALWFLGGEEETIWKFFGQNIELAQSDKILNSIPAASTVTTNGDRQDLIKISVTPKSGQREYEISNNVVIKEKFNVYPSDYLIENLNFVSDKKVVLTFDDGPDPIFTPQILSILRKYNITATFFIIGSNANVSPGITKEIARDFEIGNHTFTHPNINAISPTNLEYEINATQRVIENLTGRQTLLFRSPYALDSGLNLSNDLAPLHKISDLGYFEVNIGADSLDWQKPDSDKLAKKVIDSVIKDRHQIILFHDSGGDRSETVKALPQIIEKLKKNGYEFSTISEATGLGKDIIMPKTKESRINKLDNLGYLLLNWLEIIIKSFFLVGIIIGLVRFILIIIFAAKGWLTRRQKFDNSFLPWVSIVVPAYNEAKVIKKTIDSLLKTDYPRFEIIVVDDGSKDRTYNILTENFFYEAKVRIISQENQGKATALNHGFAVARGSIIVTLDADTIFKTNTVSLLTRHFVDQKIGAVAGNAKVGNRLNILTKLQAIEYITAQSLDRWAFDTVNSITVAPGAISAWRKNVVLAIGGFDQQTLAEDADLTIAVLKNGYKIKYDQEAVGYTEAPENLRVFLKQRFRWVFGTFQVGWKNRGIMFRPKYGTVGFFGIPNILFFQLFFSILAPIIDLMMIWTLASALIQWRHHPLDYSWDNIKFFLIYYSIFIVLDIVTAVLAFLAEKKEDPRLLFFLPLQRFFYRQLIYYVTWRALAMALKGKAVYWENTVRKNTVQLSGDSITG